MISHALFLVLALLTFTVASAPDVPRLVDAAGASTVQDPDIELCPGCAATPTLMGSGVLWNPVEFSFEIDVNLTTIQGSCKVNGQDCTQNSVCGWRFEATLTTLDPAYLSAIWAYDVNGDYYEGYTMPYGEVRIANTTYHRLNCGQVSQQQAGPEFWAMDSDHPGGALVWSSHFTPVCDPCQGQGQ